MGIATRPAGDIEVSLLARILGNGDGGLPAELARYVLDLDISERDQARMHHLTEWNQGDDLWGSRGMARGRLCLVARSLGASGGTRRGAGPPGVTR